MPSKSQRLSEKATWEASVEYIVSCTHKSSHDSHAVGKYTQIKRTTNIELSREFSKVNEIAHKQVE